MEAGTHKVIEARREGTNVWLEKRAGAYPRKAVGEFRYNVLDDEQAVGRAMYQELVGYCEQKDDDVVIVLLGGRGAQAMYRIISEKALDGSIDQMLGRLHVFTQDALGPMRMDNGLSFVRDFERLLGDAFFRKVKSFTSMQTDTEDLEGGL